MFDERVFDKKSCIDKIELQNILLVLMNLQKAA